MSAWPVIYGIPGVKGSYFRRVALDRSRSAAAF